MRRTLSLCAAFALVTACRVGRDYEPPAPAVPETWTETGSTTVEEAEALRAEPEIAWWKRFDDPELDALVERALAANLDLEGARARVREARALRDVSAGGRAPQVDLGAGVSRSKHSLNAQQGGFGQRESTLIDAGFDASWEIDVFGRIARQIEAADAGIESAEADRRAVLVGLLGEVARNYVELRGLQQQVALTRANVAVQEDTLGLTRSRSDAGLATDLDVARAEALVATTGAEIPIFDTSLRQAVHRLGILLGAAPGALSEELATDAPVPVAPVRVALGAPSDLLRRRPDVVRAERELARATALSSAATAELFPRFSIGASFGQQSDVLKMLFDSQSNTWSIGPALTMPIFRGGTLRAQVRVQTAREEQALVAYESAVLQALLEVEDALVAISRERERIVALEQAVASNRRAVELASELHLRGLADFFEVLEAQRQQFVSESSLARSATTLATLTVALYKALGGGWQVGDGTNRKRSADRQRLGFHPREAQEDR